MADEGRRPKMGPPQAEPAAGLVPQRPDQGQKRGCQDLPRQAQGALAPDEGDPQPRPAEDVDPASDPGLPGPEEELERSHGEEEPGLGP